MEFFLLGAGLGWRRRRRGSSFSRDTLEMGWLMQACMPGSREIGCFIFLGCMFRLGLVGMEEREWHVNVGDW